MSGVIPDKKAAYPLRFRPVYKDYVWGGDRIIRHFKRPAHPGRIAESWEVSTRPEGPGIVANGPLSGTPLAKLLPDFPLLLKILDARETLSVQVHPDDRSAAKSGGQAKTEMWYVLAADPGACVYCGLKPGTDKAGLVRALAAKRVGDLLVKIPVTAGNAIYVPGGRVHAIGAGCLLFECQQNSNTTYRLHDWDRTGPDGKPRDLHIEQGLRVIKWKDTAPAKLKQKKTGVARGASRWLVLDTKFFRVERFVVNSILYHLCNGKKPEVLFIAEGTVIIRAGGEFVERASAGTTYLIPPGVRSVILAAKTPRATILRITV